MANILAIGAHPDDIEFGMGATLLKLAKQGHKVSMVVLTKGEKGTHGTPEIREKESKKAAEFVNATLEFLDFEDCNVFDNYESRIKIADVVRKYKPKIVFCPYYNNPFTHKDGGAHTDHKTTGLIVREALRYARFANIKSNYEPWSVDFLVYYMVPKNKMANIVVDISNYIDDWLNLMKSHESQLQNKRIDVESRLTLLRKYYGSLIQKEFGEGFLIEEPLEFDFEWLLK